MDFLSCFTNDSKIISKVFLSLGMTEEQIIKELKTLYTKRVEEKHSQNLKLLETKFNDKFYDRLKQLREINAYVSLRSFGCHEMNEELINDESAIISVLIYMGKTDEEIVKELQKTLNKQIEKAYQAEKFRVECGDDMIKYELEKVKRELI
jgi:protein-arginine kinase